MGRRQLLTGGLAASGIALTGCACSEGLPAAGAPPGMSEPMTRINATGAYQAGVADPAERQAHLSIVVADLPDQTDPAALLRRLGQRIIALTSGSDPLLAEMPLSRLTVTVGVGPDVVRRQLGPGVPGTEDLPRFAREEIPANRRGGDLLLQICADDPAICTLAERGIRQTLGAASRTRWQSAGVRGLVDGVGARNLLGFHDGVNVPRTPAELAGDVWLATPEKLRGATIAVVRVIRLDIDGFTGLPVPRQERIIGRRRSDGSPLSGGTIDTDPDLNAKTDDGVRLIPNDAHVRRAHPLPSGADGLMLRRGYSYTHAAGDQGLIFISFQNTLRTFTRTLARLDEKDALMTYTTTMASGTFLILPGFDSHRPLGATLF